MEQIQDSLVLYVVHLFCEKQAVAKNLACFKSVAKAVGSNRLE